MVLLGFFYIMTSVLIIYFIKVQEYYAKAGNDKAVRSVIFPVFVNVLWANAFVNVYIGFVALVFTFQAFSTKRRGEVAGFSTMWTLQHIGMI